MMFKNIFFSLHLFCVFISFSAKSQSFDIYDEGILLKDVSYNINNNLDNLNFHNYPKSVKIEHNANELLDPIITLDSSEKLKVSFDILGSESESYAYTFIHCSSDWIHSDITQSEYLDGFTDNYIHQYEYSFNTISDYCHYEFSFPNEDVSFKKSGNYIVLVYDTENNIPILTKRFMVYEDYLNIEIDVKKATLAKDRDTKQEIDFFINYYYLNQKSDFKIQDPQNELQIIIQKNDDWNEIIKDCKPSFMDNKILEFDYQEDISFLGGNEYRDFDLKSLRYHGKNIASINTQNTQGGNIYYVTLQKDIIYNQEEYIFKYDLNGKYVIANSENKNKDTEGDYALIKFTLDSSKLENQDIYIYGELTNWSLLPYAKMNYNTKNNNYYGFLYLKQGYYNYQYISKDKDGSIGFIDGNYQETRNQYSIYIYYNPSWSSYDRLIGVGKSTSNNLN